MAPRALSRIVSVGRIFFSTRLSVGVCGNAGPKHAYRYLINFVPDKRLLMKSPVQIYLERHVSEPLFSRIPVSPRLGICIVIPCFDEPDLADCLDSLAQAERPDCDVEVIVVVNAPENAPPEALARNSESLQLLADRARRSGEPGFRLLYTNVLFPPGKHAGVGLARKTGMDEAVRRLAAAGCDDGLIVSLDADCRVSPNYLTALRNGLARNRKAVVATPAFEHPLPDARTRPVLRRAMIQYELYLRYYRHALRYTGFPYAYYTIGSDFAVKASAYCRAGGMGKYQGGEDFYFLRKVFPLGETVEIRTARVFPAARLSDRVPFGTGPSLIGLVGEDSGKSECAPIKYTYAWDSFRWLRFFFSKKDEWYRLPAGQIAGAWRQMHCPETGRPLPAPFLVYLESNGWAAVWEELGRNCASRAVFSRRFFESFDGLRILQALRALEETCPLRPVADETARLLKACYGLTVPAGDPLRLLHILRACDAGEPMPPGARK